MEDDLNPPPEIIQLVVTSNAADDPPFMNFDYSEGDFEPTHKKRIKHLVQKDSLFIVYIDDKNYFWWVVDDNRYGNYARDFGAVLSRAGYLESMARGLLTDSQLETLALNLGDAVARLLDDHHSDNATKSLDNAEKYLTTRSTEVARMWYISAAAIISAIAVLFCVVLWLLRSPVQEKIGLTAFTALLGAGAGSLGALISIVMRISKIGIDAMAGKHIHYFEGVIRIIAGMAGALLVTFAIKANILLGALDSAERSLPFILVIAMIAGASEKVVPNMIKRVEMTIAGEEPEKGRS